MLLALALSTARAAAALTRNSTAKPRAGCFTARTEAQRVAHVAASFDRFAEFLAPLQNFSRAEFEALTAEDRAGIVFAGFDRFGLAL